MLLRLVPEAPVYVPEGTPAVLEGTAASEQS